MLTLNEKQAIKREYYRKAKARGMTNNYLRIFEANEEEKTEMIENWSTQEIKEFFTFLISEIHNDTHLDIEILSNKDRDYLRENYPHTI